MQECITGFSGVLTAIKVWGMAAQRGIQSIHADGSNVGQVILNVNSPAFTKLYSFKVPTKYAAWLELVITYLLVPKLPILAQAAGLIAGALH